MHTLIEDKAIFGNSWVYDTTAGEWLQLNELNIFKKFSMTFDYANQTKDKPKRDPVKAKRDYSVNHDVHDLEQAFLQDYIAIFQKQFDHLLEKNLSLVNENVQLKIDMNQIKSDNEIFRIETKSLQEKLEKEKYIVELKLNDAKEYVDTLLEENKILREGTSKLNKDTNEKLERFIKENKTLTEEINTKDKRILELKEDVLNLEEEIELVSEDLLASNQKVKELKDYNRRYEEEILEKIDEVKQSHEAEVQQLLNKISELNDGKDHKFSQMIQKKNDTINKLLTQNEKIKDKFQQEAEVVKKNYARYKDSIKFEQAKNKELNVVLLEEKRKAQRLEELLAQQKLIDKNVSDNFEQAEVQAEVAQDVEQQDHTVVINYEPKNQTQIKRKHAETGKIFEINNEKIWEIRGGEAGEYCTFLEIKDKLINKEITENTFIRKKSKWWKKAKEYSEFKLTYFTQEVNGKKKVYVERNTLRAPVDLSIKFRTLNKDFSGKCLNISEGGCFVEVKDFIFYEMREGEDIHLDFIDETLSKRFSIKGKISNVIADDRGVGVQFVDTPQEELDIIKALIADFMSELEQAA